eukprot:4375690-Prymnesium_polylepis.1
MSLALLSAGARVVDGTRGRAAAGCVCASGGPVSYPWYDSSLSSSTSEAEPITKARAVSGTAQGGGRLGARRRVAGGARR